MAGLGGAHLGWCKVEWSRMAAAQGFGGCCLAWAWAEAFTLCLGVLARTLSWPVAQRSGCAAQRLYVSRHWL
jgi:hypothetical protein